MAAPCRVTETTDSFADPFGCLFYIGEYPRAGAFALVVAMPGPFLAYHGIRIVPASPARELRASCGLAPMTGRCQE
jgi:hypothetical protein